MSEDLYGREATEAAQGYTPMAEPVPEREKEKTYSSSTEGLREAASDWAERQEQTAPVTERKYIQIDGEDAGKDIPPNHTIKIDRAARDLTQIRNHEAQTAEAEHAEIIASGIDSVRANILNAEYASQQQDTQQPEQSPEQPSIQPEGDAQPEVDPEIAKALQNPKVRQALEAEAAAVEAARNHYAQVTMQAAQISAAALYASFPELSNVTVEQLPTALQIIGNQNPQRAAEIQAHLQKTQAIYQAHTQAQQHDQQMAAARLQQYTEQQDKVFEESLRSENPQTVKQVKSEIFDIAEKHYGIGRKEFAHLYQTEPLLRSAQFQRMMFDAAKFHVVARTAHERTVDVPPVQRPGVARAASSPNESEVRRANEAFKANPTPKTAAALLRARRAS